MDKEFSPDESIRLITNMINKTRQNMSDSSPYFLIWGWGTFLACIGQFVLKVYYHSPNHYQVWWVVLPCSVLSFMVSMRQRKFQKVNTYVGSAMSLLWISLGICFLVMMIIFSKIGWELCFPFFIMLYGLGTFMSGMMVKFRGLIYGGITCWILASLSVWFTYDYQILFTAAALLVSYIIPGHLLRWKNKHQ